ncbi:MAG: hypothetical protein JXB14_02925 [Candidatus Altiarchaeota archaeon]|nr:hypothetical protein [Candidatus Altiarchaeota archaeon]
MIHLRKKGQAEILDGLLLLLITAICSIALINISGNYGKDASEKYDNIYQQKMAQNALLSLYHITWNKKSVMVDVSQYLAGSSQERLADSDGGVNIQNILNWYHEQLGWHFGFAFTDDSLRARTYLTTDDALPDYDSFKTYPKKCASAALTYPVNDGTCPDIQGDMCYEMFQVCVWQR